ncbi:hypothetical protein G9F71_008215 [Clostridium sp. FP2]|uniref:hypothetical protein n=1 Tax=Clostridium sp. FP2 TaxID=2724481 RepID=UPI0013E981FE|nr:hypothetical protein [Clostridium sp. FP2]MBZ9622835.1 hypothetical protein [Clostridium sp. FP2]
MTIKAEYNYDIDGNGLKSYHFKTDADIVDITDKNNKIGATNVEGALEEIVDKIVTLNGSVTSQFTDTTKQITDLKTSVVSWKDGIYSATIGKKVIPISKDFIDLIAGINAIKTGGGNAVELDVISGKTFTNADGILRTGIATLTSLGGKKFASGTYNAMYTNGYAITVNGLSFKPSTIMCSKQTGYGCGVMYTSKMGMYYPYYHDLWSSGMTLGHQEINSPPWSYIADGGFKFALSSANEFVGTWDWIAFE